MKGRIERQIARALAMAFFVFLIAGIALGQWWVSTKAGTIQYIEGEVLLDRVPQRLSHGSYLQMENGQFLQTRLGRVELLIAPSAYLRLGENGSLRLEQNKLSDIRLSMEQGPALIEVIQDLKGSRISVGFSGYNIEIRKAGLYRFDAGSREFRVYGGDALVVRGNRETKVRACKMIRLEGNNPAPSKFDVNAADSLHRWAAQKSFDLFMASRETRRQTHWTPTLSGLLRNSNYRMRFYSQAFFEQWLISQKNQQREQTQARAQWRAAEQAAAEAAAAQAASKEAAQAGAS